METLKILVVDDEKGIQTGIRRALRGYTVSFPFHDELFEYELIDADTGEQAIEFIENEHIDIILLDNKLPGIEGIEVLEYIKEKEYDLAVIMITSYASIDLAVKATTQGAFNFVPKPFDQDELKSAVENITKHLFLKRMTKKMTDEGKEVRFKFLSVLSHELKSPINAVETYLKLMKRKELGSDFSAYEEMIDRSISRLASMRNLIMDMLDFTRVESGKKVRHPEKLNVSILAKETVDSFLPVAIQKNISIITNFPEDLIINCDRGEMEIIFNNLLSNAVKYNKENGEVNFELGLEGHSLIVVVKDTGIGMNEEEKGNLFKEFMRAKNVKAGNVSGSGLGLSIMKKIVDLNKGSVHVDTKPDEGTTFIIKIPV